MREIAIYYGVIVIVCGLVGIAVANAKKANAYQGFLWGFVLGPLGLIIAAMVLAPTPPPDTTADETLAQRIKRERDAARSASSSVADELTKLAALRDAGAITVAEFDQQKRRLLA